MTGLVQIKPPGRIDRGVETAPEIEALLAAGSPVAIGVSGGKDSCAAAIATWEHLDAIGHVGPRVLIHADLGSVEWVDSLPTCERLAKRLGCELIVCRRAAGGMMERWRGRWENNVQRYKTLRCVRTILPWSTPSMRFCTSELKSAPMASTLVKRFPGQQIVSACGIRREESSKRKGSPTWKPNKRLTNKSKRTTGIDWNPIAEWTERDVFAFCADRGFAMHEGYALGMTRISCVFCIMGCQADLLTSASVPAHRDVFRAMVALEAESAFAFQATWLADVAPQLLDDDARAAINAARVRAVKRELYEERIPDHLLYTEGWPTVMPTWDEAVMLAEVRIAVAALYGWEVEYVTPGAIIDRYAELMAENVAREARKAKKGRKSRAKRPEA